MTLNSSDVGSRCAQILWWIFSAAIVSAVLCANVWSAATVPKFTDSQTLDGLNGILIFRSDPEPISGFRLRVHAGHAGDINDDGIADLYVAEPGDSDGTLKGRVTLTPGSSSFGTVGSVAEIDLDTQSTFHIEGGVGDRFGEKVVNPGDINGDGIDDLFIGARLTDSNGLVDAGSGYLVFGDAQLNNLPAIATSISATQGVIFAGSIAGAMLGSEVSGAGDVNGDGIGDLLITAPRAPVGSLEGAGLVYLIYGGSWLNDLTILDLGISTNNPNVVVIEGLEENIELGRAVAGLGDVNSDGLDDFLIASAGFGDTFGGGPFQRGDVFVLFGNSAGGVTPSLNIDLASLGDQGVVFESVGVRPSASAAGDINGDGVNDFLVSNPSASSNQILSGTGYLIYGGSWLNNAGIAQVNQLTDNVLEFQGSDDGSFVGAALGLAGDVNGDGFDDFLTNENFGSVVIYGEHERTETSPLITSRSTIDDFGFSLEGVSVNSAGDLNDDGFPDIATGFSGFCNINQGPCVGPVSGVAVFFMPLGDIAEPNSEAGDESVIALGETQSHSIAPKTDIDRFSFELPTDEKVEIKLSNVGTAQNFDTLVRLFDSNGTLIDTNNDGGNAQYSRLVTDLSAGSYVIEVSAFIPGTVIPSYALSLAQLDSCDVNAADNKFELKDQQFELLSLPCEPPEGSTISDLFGDDIAGGYFDNAANTGTWVVFTFDPTLDTPNYVDPGPDGELNIGQGFWLIQATGSDVVIDLPDGSFAVSSDRSGGDSCASAEGCYNIPLSGAVHPIDVNTQQPALTLVDLIGNPFSGQTVAFDELRVSTTVGACSVGSDGCSLDEATLLNDGGANVLGNVMFSYDSELPNANGGLGDYVQVSRGEQLSPWQGYWVFELPEAVGNNPVLRVPR